MYKVLFVDDIEDQFNIIKPLHRDAIDGLEIHFLLPERSSNDTSKKIIDISPDLLLLDYRLDEKPVEGDSAVIYKAGPLAQQLRDAAIDNYLADFPIIAVSNEANIKKLYEPDKTVHDLFDQVYLKSEIIDHPDEIISKLNSFIEAYKEIISCFKKDNKLAKLLKIRDADIGFIDYQVFHQINRSGAPHLISMNIFKMFIDRSWLLLDTNNLIALLGIHPDEKSSEDFGKLHKVLIEKGIRYDGIFCCGFKRWWATKTKDFFEEAWSESILNSTANQRVAHINEMFHTDLKPAVSRWTNTSDTYVSFACSSCNSPTEVDFSVAAYDTISYPFMGKKRICWKCIQTGEYEERGLLVDDGEAYITDKIMHGKITP